IDDIGPGIARGRLGPVDLLEHVRRQTANAVKIFHRSQAPEAGQGKIVRLLGVRAESDSAQKSHKINDLGQIQAPNR
ncbi:MAG TPA: hypothetical protein VGA15_20470, partial [Bradyrhizobium sp.]